MGEIAYFAADVSKQELVIGCYPPKAGVTRVVNEARSISRWLDQLPAGSVVAMEATGNYHRRLADLASAHGFCVYVINPRDFYYYARGVGARGKTDPLDAELLARYVAHEHAHLHRYVTPTAVCETLTILLERRAVLVRSHQALTQSLADLPAALPKNKVLRALDQLLAAIDQQLATVAGGDRSIAVVVKRFRTIYGVGPLVGTLLAALFRRFAFRDADALISYVGLDPRPDESGQHRGRRRLSKRGHPEWRRLLVAAAMSAARSCAWRDYAQRQRAKGLPPTAVHVILARKLLRVAYALNKNNADFIVGYAEKTA